MIVRYPQDNHRDTFCVLMELLKVRGFFPSLWEGLGEGAKLGAHKPSPQPSPKGRGRKTSTKKFVGHKRSVTFACTNNRRRRLHRISFGGCIFAARRRSAGDRRPINRNHRKHSPPQEQSAFSVHD